MRRVQALIGAAMFTIAAVPKVEAQAIPIPVAACLTNPVCITIGIAIGAYSYYIIQQQDYSPEIYPAEDGADDELIAVDVVADNQKEALAKCEIIAVDLGRYIVKISRSGRTYFCILKRL